MLSCHELNCQITELLIRDAMMDREEGTTKYAEGAKREARLQSSTFVYLAHFVVKSDFSHSFKASQGFSLDPSTPRTLRITSYA